MGPFTYVHVLSGQANILNLPLFFTLRFFACCCSEALTHFAMSMRSSTYVHHAFVGCCPPFRKLTCPRLDGSPCSFSNNSRISSWSALHQGFSTTVRLSGWRSQRPSLSTDSLIRFSTGAQASIGVCLVYDGDFGPAIERTTVSSRQLVWNLDS